MNGIKFKGYKAFSDDWISIENFPNITVLIGRNNSGKSSCIDVIESLTNPIVYKQCQELGLDVIMEHNLTEEEVKSVFPESTYGGGIPANNFWEFGKNFIGERVAKELWHKGFRYQLNDKTLPGSPDIAIRRYNIAIFVDGEFWHGYDWDNKKPKLKRNREYWIEKIEENMARDTRVDKELLVKGWVPIHFWTKEVLKETASCVQVVQEIAFEIKMQDIDDLIKYD